MEKQEMKKQIAGELGKDLFYQGYTISEALDFILKGEYNEIIEENFAQH